MTSIAEAVRTLRGGGLVAFPTETVYGLGADASNEAAVSRLYGVKGRPADHPCIVHLGGADWLSRYARVYPEAARRLAKDFWPGPLTLVLEKTDHVNTLVTGGMQTVGLRVPDHPLALELLEAFGSALVAPSANRFGRISPTRAEHVRQDLGADVDLVLDGGPCRVGVESTIVDCTQDPPVVLRPGGVALQALSDCLAVPVRLADHSAVRAPGTLPAHYAPRARLILVAKEKLGQVVSRELQAGHRIGVFASDSGDNPDVLAVTAPEDLIEYAHKMYAVLRQFDRDGVEVIIVEPVAEEGLGMAINDRLRRAAASGSGVL